MWSTEISIYFLNFYIIFWWNWYTTKKNQRTSEKNVFSHLGIKSTSSWRPSFIWSSYRIFPLFFISSKLSLNCFCVTISNLEIILFNRKDGKLNYFVFSFVYSKMPIEQLHCSRHSYAGVYGHKYMNVKQVCSQIHKPQLYQVLCGRMPKPYSSPQDWRMLLLLTAHNKPSSLKHKVELATPHLSVVI